MSRRVAATICAAREGARVLLLEATGCLGGDTFPYEDHQLAACSEMEMAATGSLLGVRESRRRTHLKPGEVTGVRNSESLLALMLAPDADA